MTTTTFLQAVQDVGDDLGIRKSGIVTGGDAGTVFAENYPYRTNRAYASASAYEGAELYMTTPTWAGTPNPNQVSVYAPSAGSFAVGNTYVGDVPIAGDTFDLYLRGVSIVEIKKAVNKALRNLRYTTWAPLTYLTDGDMEASTTAAWTAVNATVAKEATGHAVHGSRSLSVTATATPGYARGSLSEIEPVGAFLWFFMATVKAPTAGSTARLVVYDETHGEELEAGGWDSSGWGVIAMPVTIPEDTDVIQVRLESSPNGAVTYWDEVIAFPLNAFDFPLPSWITRRSQVIDVRAGYPRGNFYRWDADVLIPVPHTVREDYSNPNHQFHLELQVPTINEPIYVQARRPYGELTTDSSTTFCDRELLQAYSSMELLQFLQNRPQTQDVAAWHDEYVSRRKKRPSSENIPLNLIYSGSY